VEIQGAMLMNFPVTFSNTFSRINFSRVLFFRILNYPNDLCPEVIVFEQIKTLIRKLKTIFPNEFFPEKFFLSPSSTICA